MATPVNGKNAVAHIDLMVDQCFENCLCMLVILACPQKCPAVDHILMLAGD